MLSRHSSTRRPSRRPTPPPSADAGAEIDLHIWKKPEDAFTTDLFTISHGKTSVCVDAPRALALTCFEEFLDAL